MVGDIQNSLYPPGGWFSYPPANLGRVRNLGVAAEGDPGWPWPGRRHVQSCCWKGKEGCSLWRPCCNHAGKGPHLPDQILDPEAGRGSRSCSALALCTAALPTHAPLQGGGKESCSSPSPSPPSLQLVSQFAWTQHTVNILTFACTHTHTHTTIFPALRVRGWC